MSEQSKTLIYFVGGLSDTRAPAEHPFQTLYDRVCWELDGRNEGEGIATTFIKRIHAYRQSTWAPFQLRPREGGGHERTFINKHKDLKEEQLERDIKQKSKGAQCAIPLFTDQRAEDLASQLDEDIERARREVDAEEIIIVAYSSGSALVRRALLQAKDREWEQKKLKAVANSSDDQSLIKPGDTTFINFCSWSRYLKKVIHIGGMTVGWEFNSQMPKLYLWLGPMIRPLFPSWFPWQIYRGSTFITDTRIGLNRHHIPDSHDSYYILGTQDQFLSPRDAVEPGSAKDEGKNPVYLEVQGFDHQSILYFESSNIHKILIKIIQNKKEDITKHAQSLRKERFARYIPQSDIDDYLDPMDNQPAERINTVKHVVIVLHGIRDSGFWAKRIAHRIKEQHRSGNKDEILSLLRVVSLSYGYFSLWDFLRPGGRRHAVEWFQNVYADITALYPNAEVSFVGHSNGTYLGTHALQCERLTYRYLVLAGSVVRSDFWDKKGKSWQWKKKVGRLLNLQGVDDWIVGLLPGGIETIPIVGKWMDLGGLGAYGNPWIKEDIEQIKLVGDHGAGIMDKGWDNLAKFLLKPESMTARLDLIEDSDQSSSEEKPIFKLAQNNAQLRFNNVLRHIRPVFLGLYIYLAILLCFSPLVQVVWTAFFHLPSWGTLAKFWNDVKTALANHQSLFSLGHLRQTLNTIFELPSFHSDLSINGFALALLLPLGLLGLLALVGNAWILLRRYLAMTRVGSFTKRKVINKLQFQICLSLFVYPLLAFSIVKAMALILHEAQSIMALLIILSILSFSLLKRI